MSKTLLAFASSLLSAGAMEPQEAAGSMPMPMPAGH